MKRVLFGSLIGCLKLRRIICQVEEKEVEVREREIWRYQERAAEKRGFDGDSIVYVFPLLLRVNNAPRRIDPPLYLHQATLPRGSRHALTEALLQPEDESSLHKANAWKGSSIKASHSPLRLKPTCWKEGTWSWVRSCWLGLVRAGSVKVR